MKSVIHCSTDYHSEAHDRAFLNEK